jgi:hypothetical protein
MGNPAVHFEIMGNDAGPDRVPNGPVIALFSDPEGHVVGLVEAI